MLLAVDIGNTNITMGLFRGEILMANFRLTTQIPSTSDEYGVFIKETESFVSLTQSNLDYIIENCPRFVEAIEENEIGQQLGDVDNDGCLSVVDATYIQRCLAEYDDWEMTVYDRVNLDGGNEYVYISDIDRDGERSILDATAIQKKLARIE